MPPIVIDGGFGIDPGERRPATVLVRGETIEAVAWSDEDRASLRMRGADTVDASGCWLAPGLIDAHAHAYGALLRGTENSLPLELWALHTTIHGRAMDAGALRAAILLGAAERIRSGITGTVDHSPMMHLGREAIAAHEASGLRVAYAPFLHDLSDYDLLELPLPDALRPLVGGPPPLDEAAYARDFAALVQIARSGSGRVRVQLGPNAPQRCSRRAWALWRTLRDRHDVAVHTHLLETRAQASLNPRWPGGLVCEMERQGLLEGALTCAHGVWLSDGDLATLARYDVTVSHNPASNLMLGSGTMRFGACAACGVRVALGTDSANTGGRHDLFGVMRLAMMLPRDRSGGFETWPRHADVFSAATDGGAAALGMRGQLGRIAPGQRADLVLLRATDAATLAAVPSLAVLVQHAGSENVDSVMVNGNRVMRVGEVLSFDEREAIADAQDQAAAVSARAAMRVAILQAAMPTMRARFLQTCG